MKKLIFLLIAVFYAINTMYSQSWEELSKKTKKQYQKGNYQAAIEYAEKARIQAKNEFGTGDENYAISSNYLAVCYHRIGAYEKAEQYYIEAKDIKKNVLGPDHPDYATSLTSLALLYMETGAYKEAESLFNEAIDIMQKAKGPDDPEYAALLNHLGTLYLQIGEYDKAKPLFIKAIDIRKKVLGTRHLEYGTSLNNIALLYHQIGEYDKAEQLYIEAKDIKKRVRGPHHDEYATALNNIAKLYEDMGAYEEAEVLYIKAIDIKKKFLGPDHPGYAIVLCNLGRLYYKKGVYEKAEPLIKESFTILKNRLSPSHPYYATTLTNLAVLYYEIGDYEKAESLCIEALRVYKEVLGPAHPDYATTLSNLAILYYKIGNYGKAAQLYREVISIRGKVLRPAHPDYATSLHNLAVLYAESGEYEKAEQYYIEAKDIKEKILGPNHPDYAIILNALACLYQEMGAYNKAEQFYIESINIRKKALSPDHPGYANSLNNLALFYQEIGDYKKAELLLLESLNIMMKIFGPDHPDCVKELDNLAYLYYEIGDYEKTESYIRQANQNLYVQIEKYFGFLTEKEKELYLSKHINFALQMYNSFFLDRKEQNPANIAIAYNNAIVYKGLLLQSNTALRQAVTGSSDEELKKTYNRFIDIHRQLSMLYSKPIADRRINIDSLVNIANTLEKELMNRGKDLPGIEDLTGISKIKWKDIQENLKPNEAAIEFVNFRYYSNGWTDSTYYCAFVLRKDYLYPRMIYLFEEKQLLELVSTPKATNNSYYIGQLYSYQPDIHPGSIQSSNQNQFYQLIWDPVESHLKGISKIYMAPSGLLHKVAFNAIPITDSTYLSDKYSIDIVSSTRILAEEKKALDPVSDRYKAALYGGIEYDLDSAEMIALSHPYQGPENKLLASRSISIPDNNRGYTWSYLDGTLSEVSTIKDLLKSKQVSTTLYTGKFATEESFKHLTDTRKSPEIIHLATHGFFFPAIKPDRGDPKTVVLQTSLSKEPTFIRSENPLFRSGIIMAGASRCWNNLPAIEGVEDGTLTAYEVSNMNLSNTRLVVLSACETGLGDVRGSEGVFGLQRAFKMAGARYIIMSLWQVPDYQTSLLMNYFYTNWLSGMTLRMAFSEAQLAMREKYGPFYWAAFVLVE